MDHLRELVGEFGNHLKLVSRALEVDVRQRGNQLVIGSAGGSAVDAERALAQLSALIRNGYPLHTRDIEHALKILRNDPSADLGSYFHDTIWVAAGNRPVNPRTANQRAYISALRTCDITLGVGPAGTGKTFLAIAMAVAALRRNEVKRLVLTRPAVEAGEHLGFLPGTLTEKVDPYLRPLFDALDEMLTPERKQRLVERGEVEVAPLAFMRGRTLTDAWVILDEAQNTTVEQMKMFLTRLGERSHMVVTGDITQIDLPRGQRSGLVDALDVVQGVEGVGVVRFGAEDVVRHPLVARIVDAYAAAESRSSPQGPGRPRPADRAPQRRTPRNES